MTTTAYIIIAANLLPLLMTLGGGWGLSEILPLYWSESAVIGFFTILKILSAGGPIARLPSGGNGAAEYTPQNAIPGGPYSALAIGAKLFLAAFFVFHFGMFMFVHGMFLFGFVLQGMRLGKATVDPLSANLWLHYLWAVKWAILALFLGHGMSFYMNYLGAGEYRNARPSDCMTQPYSRIVVMQFTILLGAFLAIAVRGPGPVLVLFIAAKIFADVHAHLKERARAAAVPAAVPATPGQI